MLEFQDQKLFEITLIISFFQGFAKIDLLFAVYFETIKRENDVIWFSIDWKHAARCWN